MLASHPIQYQVPVFREVSRLGLPVTAIFGSDFSVQTYHDSEFGISLSWDVDLLSGYDARFLSRVADGGSSDPGVVRAHGAADALRQLNPSAVMLTGYRSRFNRGAAAAAFRFGAPVLLRAETTDVAIARSPLKRAVRDASLRAFYRRIDRFLYIGQNSRDHYTRLGVPEEALVFAPYGVDTAPFDLGERARTAHRVATRAALGWDDSLTVIAYAGKLSHRKGVDLLIDAMASQGDEERGQLGLLLIGDGGERAALVARAERHGIPVRAVGFKNQTELSPYYHAADLFALPSRASETWGLVVNEALHHGLPCLVSDAVGSARDLVVPGETGETFASGNVMALQQALSTLLTWTSGTTTEREHCTAHVAPYSPRAAADAISQATTETARITTA